MMSHTSCGKERETEGGESWQVRADLNYILYVRFVSRKQKAQLIYSYIRVGLAFLVTSVDVTLQTPSLIVFNKPCLVQMAMLGIGSV